MAQVPNFFSNTDDNLHCFEAVLKMVLDHFEPDSTYTYEQLDELTSKDPNKWSWPTKALITLQEKNYDIAIIGNFDWQRFSYEGSGYLKEFYGESIAKEQIKNSNITQETKNAKVLVDKIKVSKRIPTIKDMQKYLDFCYLMICYVNSNTLAKNSGFTGHFVLVYEVDDQFIYYHDPGLPPKKSAKTTHQAFEKAWAATEENTKSLIMIRKKNPYKIFGVGLSKTGTTSLNEALNQLGFFAIHYPLDDEIIDRADALTDIPVAYRYIELDKKYPNSKFILTTRDMVSWLKSMKKHFARKPAEFRSEETLKHRKNMYRSVEYNTIKMLIKKFIHEYKVKKYFQNRPDNFLVMNIIAGDGWEKLCNFLDKEVPSSPFPKKNVTNITQK